MKIGIIGAGINGAAVAFFLSRFGEESADVHVFESGHIAGDKGSTAYSAGIMRHFYSTEQHIRIARRGTELLYEFEDLTGREGGVHQNGYLRLVDEEHREVLEDVVTRTQRAGVDARLVDPEDLPEYLPGISPDDVAVATYDPTGGFADPYLVTTGLIAAAREQGVTVHTQTSVTGVEETDGEATALQTPSGRHDIDYVVNAAGPWGDEVARMVDVEVPLDWHESKIAVLKSDTPYGPDLPTLSDHSVKPDMYAKPEPGGEFIVGGIDRPPVDRKRGLEGIDNEHLQQLSERVEGRLPGYADAEVHDTWSGVITMTPDAHQIVGVPAGMENFYNVLGGSGHGFKDALGFAESIAQEILGDEPRYDLSAYRLERFEEGDEIPDTDEKTHGYD